MDSNSIEPRMFNDVRYPAAMPAAEPAADEDTPLPDDSFSRTETTGAEKTASPPAEDKRLSMDPGRTIDEALRDLDSIMSTEGWASNSLNYAQNDVRSAESDLRRAGFSLTRVKMDNEQTNVSNEGYTLDMIFSDVKRDTGSSKRNMIDADRKVDDSSQKLSGITNKIASLERELNLEPEKYRNVIPLLRNAQRDLGGASSSSTDADRLIHNIERSIERADSDLTMTSTYTMQVKFDGPGKNVSYAGFALDSMVNRAESDLSFTGTDMYSTQADLRESARTMQNAAESLKRARTELGNIPA
jgi:hypothetical protein